MDPATTTLLIDLVIIPVIKKLAARRGVGGKTRNTLEEFTKDPKKILTKLQKDSGLLEKVVEDLADAVENVAGDAINALTDVFALITRTGAAPEE